MLSTIIGLALVCQSPQSPPLSQLTPPRFLRPRTVLTTEPATRPQVEILERETIVPETRRGIYWEPPRLSLSLGKLRVTRRQVQNIRSRTEFEETSYPEVQQAIPPAKSLPTLPTKSTPQSQESGSDRELVDALRSIADGQREILRELRDRDSKEDSRDDSTMPQPPPIPGPPQAKPRSPWKSGGDEE